MISHPMAGVLVVDFTQYVAGPVCTRAMAELGAEVIKIEPPQGDETRAMPVKRNGRSAYFIQQNLGKRSLCRRSARQAWARSGQAADRQGRGNGSRELLSRATTTRLDPAQGSAEARASTP